MNKNDSKKTTPLAVSATTGEALHYPVLLTEVMTQLAIKPEGIYVDATYGRGGHSGAILQQLGEHGRLVVFDRDPEAIAHAREQLAGDSRVSVVHGAFADLEARLDELSLVGKIDGLLIDLGVSSPQLDDGERGFSFMRDGPLDMRMDPTSGISAEQWLADSSAETIAGVLKRYGDERYAKRIARAVKEAFEGGLIISTKTLAEVIAEAHPNWVRGHHPATRSFQAIRIELNDELGQLEKVLEQSVRVLSLGGRVAVISFHSIEDRIVKQFFKKITRYQDAYPKDLPIIIEDASPMPLRLVGKPIAAGEEELAVNPRARSARLRVVERVL